MPVAIPRRECTRTRSNTGQTLGATSDLENAMLKPKTGSHSSAFLDTPGYITCTITPEHTATQRCILGQSMVGQCDHHLAQPTQPTDSVRAIVNVEITTDSVIRTHVSLFDSTSVSAPEIAPYKSIPDATSFSFDQSPFEAAIARKAIIDTGPTRGQGGQLISDALNQSPLSQDGDRDGDAREAASVLRTLYSVEPSIYSGACEPLAHWIADHVWKVTTQGLSLPLAFIGPSSCADLPLEPLPVLIESISSLLLSTLIQPSAIILSLFYIARLPAYIGNAPFHSLSSSTSAQRFNTLLLSADSVAQEDPVVQALYASFKLFVLGAILSNKILDDHVFTMKTWHDVSGIPLRVLNELEWLGLDILSHELFVDPSSWKQWVQTLYSHHLFMRGPLSRGSQASQADGKAYRVKVESYRMVRYMLEGLMKVGEPGEKLAKDGSTQDFGSYSPPSSLYSNDNRHSYPGNTNAGYSPITVQSSTTNADREPSPIFLGIQDRIEAKLLDEKHSEDLDGFEMDDDGPLREEYLPRRRSKEAIGPFYQESQRSSAYGTPNISAYPPQEYGRLTSNDRSSSLSEQFLGRRMDAHSPHVLPTRGIVNDGNGNGPAPYKTTYAPPTTSLFSFPSSACHPTLPSFGFGFGFGDIDNMYGTGGAPGLGYPGSNYPVHGISHPGMASTLCDYFLSYSRVRVC